MKKQKKQLDKKVKERTHELLPKNEELAAKIEGLTLQTEKLKQAKLLLEQKIEERTSDLHNAIEKLSIANERFEETLNFGKLSIGILDYKTQDVNFSTQLLQILDLPAEKQTTINIQRFADEFVLPDDKHIIFETLQEGIQGAALGGKEIEFRIKSALGAIKLLKVSALFRGKEAIGVVQDITGLRKSDLERKKMEEELFESETYLRGILDSTNDGILAVDNHGKVINSNNRFAELWHIPQELIEQKDDSVLLTQVLDQLVNPEAFLSKVQELYNSDKTDFDTLTFKDRRIFERYSTPLILNKNIVGRVWSFRDITERKKAEESVRHAEERYRNIFENALVGIYQSTPEGQFISANPTMAKMFGYSSPAELMASVKDIGSQLYADPQERIRVNNLIAQEGHVYGVEFKCMKKNKDITWVSGNMFVIRNTDGSIKYFEGTLTDITARKEAEEKLIVQLEMVQKTNYELDRFVYSASHDLRAPLSSILGLVNIVELEKPPSSIQNYMKMIRSSINHLDGFIKDILNYSRNSRMELRIEKIDFHELTAETQNNLRLMSGAEHLQVTIEINDDVAFYSDRTRIGILISNLFSNAIKYQDNNKSPFLFIGIKTSPEKVMIVFKDNGVGIEKKHLDKIFDMFYRASEKSTGAGLGLYIEKETVAKLSGTLKVESEFGVSTTFEITIPNLYMG